MVHHTENRCETGTTLKSLTFLPPPYWTVSDMGGEGMGYDTTAEQREQLAQTPFNTTPDVVSAGDIAIDRVYDLSDAEIAEYCDTWEQEDWYPGPGESRVVEDVPNVLDTVDHDVFLGGRGPNQAVAAARSGADTSYLGSAGDQRLLQSLENNGVDTGNAVYGAAKEDSTAYVFREPDGENRIAFVHGTGTALAAGYLADCEDVLASASYVLLNNGEPDETLEVVFDMLDDVNRPEVVFDPAPADGAEQWLDHDSIAYVTPNEQEYAALEDDLADYDGTVIRTAADGATVDGSDGTYHVKSPEVDPVDTTGAGDTFNGYLAGCLADGMELEDAVEYAGTAAALSVTEEGAQTGMPEMEEVEQYLER